MMAMIILGLIPIALILFLLGFFAARTAKKLGKNPWLYGSLAVLVITAASWQQFPKWAGYTSAYERYALHSIFSRMQNTTTDPNAMQSFKLSPRQNTSSYVPVLPQNAYTFNIPARYQVEHPIPNLVRLHCKYPSMEASPGSPLREKVVSLFIGTDTGHMRRPQNFVARVAETKAFGEYIGKQGSYDVYQTQNVVTNGFDKSWLFTAQDGQPVLVEIQINDSRNVWHDIGNDLVVNYVYWPVVDDDFIKVDEVVMNFVKAHLESQPIQDNGTLNRIQ